jgi:hypothetical protein
LTAFESHSASFTGDFTVNGTVDEVFPLFSPDGERSWVPEWDPELLHPRGAVWQEGLIFRTREECGDAIWIVRRLDQSHHIVAYDRVEPERYVARVKVQCSAAGQGRTDVTTTYEFIGLSDTGNHEIGAMTPDAYAAKMRRWQQWIDDSVSSRDREQMGT